MGAGQLVGVVVVLGGAAPTLWSVLAFVFVGHGAPAPFDAPRRLVRRGPYRYVRNPMYLGADLVLLGVALAYQSWLLAGYAVLLAVLTHLFVIVYQEPALSANLRACAVSWPRFSPSPTS